MNKLKTFFTSLFKSSTHPTYGNDIVRASGGFSAKYFIFFTFLTAIATTVLLSIPLAAFPVSRIGNELSSLYPVDLEVTLDPQSGLSINQPLPYTVYVNDVDQTGQLERVALVTFASESADLTFEKIASFDAALVITDKNLYARRQEDGRFEVTEIPTVEKRFTFDRAMLDQGINAILNNPIVKNKWYVPFLALMIFGIAFPLMLVGRGLTAAFYALITWVITSLFMRDKKVSYGKVLQLSVHTLTPVVIVAYILDYAGYTFFHGWWYFLAFLAWTLVMLSQLKPAGVNSAPVVTTPTPVAKTVAPKKAAPATRKRKVASKR